MKQYVLALALMLTLNVSAAGVQPRHRHHAPTEQVAGDTTAQNRTATVAATSGQDEGIDAYSDTTSTAIADADTAANTHRNVTIDWDGDEFGDTALEKLIGAIVGGTAGVGAVLIVIGILLIVCLVIAAPIIVIVLLLRYLLKNHNNRVRLAEKAMETGQPIPESVQPRELETPEYYWKRGVRNAAIGAGLLLMFWIWGDSELLMGIGALVLCQGVGQMIISKTTSREH